MGSGIVFQALRIISSRPRSRSTTSGFESRQGTEGDTIVESRAGLLTDALADRRSQRLPLAIRRSVTPVLTYVANAIRIGDREIPYSTVTGDRSPAGSCHGAERKDPRPLIWLNEWAAEDLGREGRRRRHARLFPLVRRGRPRHEQRAVHARRRGADDRHRRRCDADAGVSGHQRRGRHHVVGSAFPVDLKRVRKKDEDYWDQYRARAEGDHHGRRRAAAVGIAIRQGVVAAAVGRARRSIAQAIDPVAAGLHRRAMSAPKRSAPRRARPTSASTSSTSVSSSSCRRCCSPICSSPSASSSARPRSACSRRSASPRRRSAACSSAKARSSRAIGAAIGALAAIGYSALILYGLRTWWVGAVGTTDLDAARRAASGWPPASSARLPSALIALVARRARDEPPIGARAAQRRCRRRADATRVDWSRRSPRSSC